MDLKDERFLSWLRANGASIEKVEWPSYRTVGGVRGTVAVADIATNEPIFEIPHRLMMSPAHASESPEIGGIISTEKDVLVGDFASLHYFAENSLLRLVFSISTEE